MKIEVVCFQAWKMERKVPYKFYLANAGNSPYGPITFNGRQLQVINGGRVKRYAATSGIKHKR